MKYFFLLAFGISLVACKKKAINQKFGNYELHLCDAPGYYDHLYLDIVKVSVNVTGEGWFDLENSNLGIVDLLSFDNGIDTLLGSVAIPVGSINQIRLMLGANNSIVVNGEMETLIVPSAQQSGVKINVNTTITEGTTVEWLDIDAGKSVQELGNGIYRLTPVMRTFSAAKNGRFRGYVFPVESYAYVLAINQSSGDTLIAIPEDDGYYQLSGLQGNYNVVFKPGIGTYNTMTLENSAVYNADILTLPTINL